MKSCQPAYLPGHNNNIDHGSRDPAWWKRISACHW